MCSETVHGCPSEILKNSFRQEETNDMTTDRTALEEVRERFSITRFATGNGAVIEAVEEGYAKCSIILNETHRNALRGLSWAAQYLRWQILRLQWHQTGIRRQAFHSLPPSVFLAGQKGAKLIAEAVKLKEGRKTCYYEVTVCDELGNQVAHMTSNGYCLDRN